MDWANTYAAIAITLSCILTAAGVSCTCAYYLCKNMLDKMEVKLRNEMRRELRNEVDKLSRKSR